MRIRALSILLLAAGVLGLQACGGEFPQSALHPVSDFAHRLDDLFRTILWWAIGVFVVVQGVLVYTLIRFRSRPGDPRPRPIHGHTLLEIGWTLAPALILVVIAIPTIRTIFVVDSPPEGEALTIEVVGRQWWWEFRYPESGVVTANEAHIPVGRTVAFRLRTADVLHSFWVPRLGGKRDLVPGRENLLWFRADSVGTYPGQCAEYCGTSHALMGLRIIVDSPAEFEAWTDRMAAAAESPSDRDASRGRSVFMSNACVGCHRIGGTAAAGVFGPDLTHLASRGTIAAGVLENSAENMARWLRNPQEVKPGNLMGHIQLTDDQILQLTAYLMSLR